MEGYFALSLFSLGIANQGFDWSDSMNIAQGVFAIIAIVICGISHLAMSVYFRLKISLFKERQFQEKFGSVIGDLNYKSKSSAGFISIFCYRRLVQTVLIIYAQQYPCIQVQLMSLTCIFALIFFASCDVYHLKQMRRLEFYNEATIMLCVQHSFLFTDFIDDPQDRYTIGYSLIGATILNIGGNLAIMIFNTLLNVIDLYKRLSQRFRKWRHIRKQKQKLKLRLKNKVDEKLVEKIEAEIDKQRRLMLDEEFLQKYHDIFKQNLTNQDINQLEKFQQNQINYAINQCENYQQTRNNQQVVPERIMNEIQNTTEIKRNQRRRLFDLPSDITQNIEMNTLLKSEIDAI